jgi:hypothetical protein
VEVTHQALQNNTFLMLRQCKGIVNFVLNLMLRNFKAVVAEQRASSLSIGKVAEGLIKILSPNQTKG